MPVPVTCPDRAMLEQLVLGLLTDREADLLEGHVQDCAGCLQILRSLQQEDGLVQTVRRGARAEPLLPGEVDNDLLARLYRLLPNYRFPAESTDGLLPVPSADDTPGPENAGEDDFPPLGPSQRVGELGQFGPFPILQVLGTGGMGIVYQTWQLRPRRLAALKVSRTGPWTDRARLARFLGEVEVIARLQHPHIVPVYEAGEHEGQPYFLMEYLEGGSLAQKLAAAPLAPRAAGELVQTLARAVHFAHQHGVVHRDLKPANVLLTGEGVPKISDFGLAKQLAGAGSEEVPGQATASGVLLGTPAYMAPEQAQGNSAVGPAADLYALGAILYECLTGRPPFKAASVLETLEQVRSQEPVPPRQLQPGVPRDLQTICLKCLEKDPGRRYPSAGALADDLGRFLRGEPISARPVGRLERVLKWARRRPAVAGLLALCGLTLVGLLAGGLVYNALLHEAVRQAEANEAEARRQQQLARAQYRAARAALTRMLTRLEAIPPADVPRFKKLRRQQMEDSLAFYQEVIEGQDHADPAVREDTAIAHEQAASIQFILGRTREAEENFRQAVVLLEGLPAELREHPDEQARLTHCHNHLASLARDAGRLDEEAAHFTESLAICERMVRKHPGNPEWQNNLARAHHNLGEMYQTRQDWPQAESHYRRAITLREALVRDHPKREHFRSELGGTYQNLGLMQAQTGRHEKAIACCARAEQLLAPLVRAHPGVQEFVLPLASTCIVWGNTLKDTGHSQEALARLDRAVALAEDVLHRDPLVTRYYVRSAHAARGQVYEILGRHAEAARDWDRAIALDDDPARSSLRLNRAIARARAGQHAQAAAEAARLAAEQGVSGDTLYNLACVDALCVAPAQSDASLPAARRAETAERYATAAVALLERLRTAGYFRHPEQVKLLRTDPDLASLRARPDFQALLRSAHAKAVEKGALRHMWPGRGETVLADRIPGIESASENTVS